MKGLFNRGLSKKAREYIKEDQYNDNFFFKENQVVYSYSSDNNYHRYIDKLRSRFKSKEGTNYRFLIDLNIYNLKLVPIFCINKAFLIEGLYYGPRPKRNEEITFIFPNYIVWEDDESYTSFSGSPDQMKLPKNDIDTSVGYYRPFMEKQPNYLYGLSGIRPSILLSDMDGL